MWAWVGGCAHPSMENYSWFVRLLLIILNIVWHKKPHLQLKLEYFHFFLQSYAMKFFLQFYTIIVKHLGFLTLILKLRIFNTTFSILIFNYYHKSLRPDFCYEVCFFHSVYGLAARLLFLCRAHSLKSQQAMFEELLPRG